MLLIAICAVIGFIIGFAFGLHDTYSRLNDLWSWLGSALISCVIGFLASMVGGLVGVALSLGATFILPSHWQPIETDTLISLRSGEGVSGQFYLGYGNVGSKPYFFYYRQVENGYQPGSIAAEGYNVTVHEEQRSGGQLTVYVWTFTQPWFELVALRTPQYRYEFYIPEGSLKKDFTLQ